MQYIDYIREDISLSEIQEIFGSDCEIAHSPECRKSNNHLKCVAKSEKLYYSDDEYMVYAVKITCPKCFGESYYNVEKFSIMANELVGWKEN